MKNLLSSLLIFTASAAVFAQFNAPESVIYDSTEQRYLVSNAGGGTLAQISHSGAVTTWVSGLNGPKGMAILNGILYVSCVNRVRGFALEDGSDAMNLQIPGASFLNDLTEDGIYLYVSDTQANRIIRVDPSDTSFTVLVASGLASPNGLLHDAENNRLLLCSFRINSPIQAIDLTSGTVSTVRTTTLSDLDGLTRDQYGYYYLSSWGTNSIYRFDPAFANNPELISSGHNGPADIFYNQFTDTLAVPNMNSNTLSFLNLRRYGVLNLPETEYDWDSLSYLPAPVWSLPLQNTGQGNLTVTSIAALHLPEVFTVEPFEPWIIPPGASDTILVPFQERLTRMSLCRAVGFWGS
jgi:sugar lactone lactonase YvrE